MSGPDNQLAKLRSVLFGEPSTIMTKQERSEILRVISGREKLAKKDVDARAMMLEAEFEKQISTEHKFDKDEVWRESVESAEKEVAEAQKRIDKRSKELGIPKRFAPKLGTYWLERGENLFKQRREELRRLAKAQIAAASVVAKNEIERLSQEAREEIVKSGLGDKAKAVLESMPSVETLMPALKMREVERMLTDEEDL
jgi:hypothetical protein